MFCYVLKKKIHTRNPNHNLKKKKKPTTFTVLVNHNFNTLIFTLFTYESLIEAQYDSSRNFVQSVP